MGGCLGTADASEKYFEKDIAGLGSSAYVVPMQNECKMIGLNYSEIAMLEHAIEMQILNLNERLLKVNSEEVKECYLKEITRLRVLVTKFKTL